MDGLGTPSPTHMDSDDLLDRAAAGDKSVLTTLFDRYRAKLRAMVVLRMDPASPPAPTRRTWSRRR